MLDHTQERLSNREVQRTQFKKCFYGQQQKKPPKTSLHNYTAEIQKLRKNLNADVYQYKIIAAISNPEGTKCQTPIPDWIRCQNPFDNGSGKQRLRLPNFWNFSRLINFSQRLKKPFKKTCDKRMWLHRATSD